MSETPQSNANGAALQPTSATYDKVIDAALIATEAKKRGLNHESDSEGSSTKRTKNDHGQQPEKDAQSAEEQRRTPPISFENTVASRTTSEATLADEKPNGAAWGTTQGLITSASDVGPAITEPGVQHQVSPNGPLANRILKENFGLDKFRLQQEQAITRILDGHSSVVVFPTGGGKSLCYQVPAVAFRYQDEANGVRRPQESGVTVVIAPLISLMKDQVDALLRRNVKAACLHSQISREQFLTIHEDLRNGNLDLLYCAPERLNCEGFLATLKSVPGGIRLLAVDEAHCISEWGHSFRPDYLKIARFAKESEVERVVCLTATATAKVAQDICDAFSVPLEGLFKTTVYRPNLRLLARASSGDHDNVGDLISYVRANPGPTLVYVNIQRGAEEIAEELDSHGFNAKAYHSKVDKDKKAAIQDEFLASKNMIIVATIAFGMGIDKPDIRNIIHFDAPSSVEAYSQQIGRAGRDGLPSTCMFYLSNQDFYLRDIFIYGDRPSKRALRKFFEHMCTPERRLLGKGDTFQFSLKKQPAEVDIGENAMGIICARLELDFHLFRAIGTIYKEYKYKVLNSAELSAENSEAALALRTRIIAGRWTDLDTITEKSQVPRTDLVRKLNAWDERGSIELQKRAAENIYRLERPLPSPQEITDIINKIDISMEEKEAQDLSRVQHLIKLVTDKQCFSRALQIYFGETSNPAWQCKHCTWCETRKRITLPHEPPEPPDQKLVKRILKATAIRDDPRLLAKVAFGITSPRIRSEKLNSKNVFESMNACGFLELVDVFRAACEGEGWVVE